MLRSPLPALALAALLAGAPGLGGCAATRHEAEPAPHVVTDDTVGEEEVLSDDREEPEETASRNTPTTKAGELLVAVGYVALILGSAILPYLLLL